MHPDAHSPFNWLHLPSIIVLALSLILLSALPVRAESLPIEDYWQRVEQARAQITLMHDQPPEAIAAQTSTLAAQFQAITNVILPNGAILAVDHSRLVALLQATPPDLDEIARTLDTLMGTRRTWPPARPVMAGQETLDDILSRPEFQWPEETTPQPSFLQEWFDRLMRSIQSWLSDLSGPALAGDILAYILPALAMIALVIVLFFVLRNLFGNVVSETALADAHAGIEHLTANTAMEKAQSLSHSGDYRSAIRYLYLSALLLLEERGLLYYDRSKTNREYIRSVAHHPDLARILRDVVDIFDRTWYGFQPVDQATYTHYVKRVEALRKQR